VNFLAEPALRPDAEAVAHQQHPHHELRIDRRTTGVAIERCQVSAQLREIEESIDAAQKMIRWNVLVEVEGIKQSVLVAAVLSHHAAAFSLSALSSDRANASMFTSFSTE
jgi:hypothetical protein